MSAFNQHDHQENVYTGKMTGLSRINTPLFDAGQILEYGYFLNALALLARNRDNVDHPGKAKFDLKNELIRISFVCQKEFNLCGDNCIFIIQMTESLGRKPLKEARFLYLLLAGIFISLLVCCNLIFLKFIQLDFGFTTATISVGLLPYPLTFLVTDLISEIFGEKRANDVVKAGLVCALLIMGFTYLADIIPAAEDSVLSNDEFTRAFGMTGISVASSMIAYLLAQFIDIRIYHFWKKRTAGRMLWLRNNCSTFTSQIIDTLAIFTLLCGFGVIPWESFGLLFFSSLLYKLLVAAADTPFLYLFVYLIKRRFNLTVNQEVDLN